MKYFFQHLTITLKNPIGLKLYLEVHAQSYCEQKNGIIYKL